MFFALNKNYNSIQIKILKCIFLEKKKSILISYESNRMKILKNFTSSPITARSFPFPAEWSAIIFSSQTD